jgi:hypothetical protein
MKLMPGTSESARKADKGTRTNTEITRFRDPSKIKKDKIIIILNDIGEPTSFFRIIVD